MSDLSSSKWLLLTHHIPAQPSGLRVKVWRRLQAIGAVAVRKSVYVLPASSEALEDFQWLRQEITDAGGEATVFSANTVDSAEDEQVIKAFQEARDRDYAALLKEVRTVEKACLEGADTDVSHEVTGLRRRFEAVVAIDHFEAPGRAETLAALRRCDQLIETPEATPRGEGLCDPSEYRRRRWVTRQGLHIDRLASAWLIRRYIDPEARFAFVKEGAKLRQRDVPFDMFGVDFGHHGDDCTFETLVQAFGLRDAAVVSIGHVVHDADLKDGKFSRGDTDGIEKAIRALGSQLPDDELVEVGMVLFDGLLKIVQREGLP